MIELNIKILKVRNLLVDKISDDTNCDGKNDEQYYDNEGGVCLLFLGPIFAVVASETRSTDALSIHSDSLVLARPDSLSHIAVDDLDVWTLGDLAYKWDLMKEIFECKKILQI